MSDELTELLDTAIYKEIASRAFYVAGQSKTEDPGAKALMKEPAEEELKHSQLLKSLKEKGLGGLGWHRENVPNLMISENLTSGETLEGVHLQDTLIFAMKHEQESVDFYSRMMEIIVDRDAKQLCQKLVSEELKHKLRLEVFYDDLFYGEN